MIRSSDFVLRATGRVPRLVAFLGVAVAGLAAGARAQQDPALAEGKVIYGAQCAGCHGLEGDGQGEAAYLLWPKPRDLTQSSFAFRSTPSGELPTDDDLARTIRRGIPGTPMVRFAEILSEAEIRSVVRYVKSFNEEFGSYPPQEVVEIPDPPEATPAQIERGSRLYAEMKCWDCHGRSGQGDGPSAPTLTNDWGYFIQATDFSRGIFKNGEMPQDLYRTIVTGLSGTPMPSYADSLEEPDRWALVQYVLSLSAAPRVAGAASAAVIAVQRTSDDALFRTPDASAWGAVPAQPVDLRPLWPRDQLPDGLTVRAVADSDRVAVLLEWEDGTENYTTLASRGFTDAVAVQFALGDRLPFIGMGDAQEGGQSNLWHWRADFDRDRRQARLSDVEDQHPGMAVDWYPFQENGDPAERRTFEATSQHPQQEAVFLTGRGVGNPFSTHHRLQRPIMELNAVGFGTLTPQKPEEQDVTGGSVWHEGRWRVLFVRQRGGRTRNADVKLSGRVPVSFAVWDGFYGDRDGQKAISGWHWLQLD